MTARRVSITRHQCAGRPRRRAAKVYPTQDRQGEIANAMSAAPKAVAQDATIVDIDGKGSMKVLREGGSSRA